MDNYTMDELILAFALKFENNAPVILQRLFEGTPVSVEEIDEILKKVEEKYVVITSDDYPDFFHRVDNPSFVFFYEGNLELFDQCDHYFEKTVDGYAEGYSSNYLRSISLPQVVLEACYHQYDLKLFCYSLTKAWLVI